MWLKKYCFITISDLFIHNSWWFPKRQHLKIIDWLHIFTMTDSSCYREYLLRMKTLLNPSTKRFFLHTTEDFFYWYVSFAYTGSFLIRPPWLKPQIPNVALFCKYYLIQLYDTCLCLNTPLIHEPATHNWWSPIATTGIFINTAT
jgi:hypothetical protein